MPRLATVADLPSWGELLVKTMAFDPLPGRENMIEVRTVR